MQITWHGLDCFRIQGKEVNILTDPHSDKTGLKLPRFQTDIVTVSSDLKDGSAASGTPFTIEIAGEYEVKGAFIYGVPFKTKEGKLQNIFRIDLEGLTIGHLSNVDALLSSKQLEILEGVDVLMLSIGDLKQLSSKDAVGIVSQIEPRIVIPMGYTSKGLKEKREKPEAFLKELGIKSETVDKIKLQKKDLPTDERLVYLFEMA